MTMLTEAQLIARDRKRDIGAELLEAIREIKAGGGRRFTVRVSQATEARFKLGMSQTEFAKMLGVSARTLQGLGAGSPTTERCREGLAEGCHCVAEGCAQGVEGGVGMTLDERWRRINALRAYCGTIQVRA